MAFEYLFLRAAPINQDKLEIEIVAAVPTTDGFHQQTEGEILVISPVELTQQQINTLATVIANHDPALTNDQQAEFDGKAQLASVLSNHKDLLVYSDYFYRLQKDLFTLVKTMPNLTDTTTAVYIAVRQNKASDTNHLAMYNRFLWFVERTTNVALVSGDLPASPTAAQAQTINAAAFRWTNMGVELSNMLLRFS